MNNPFTTNEAKLKRQATEAGNAFREALAEQPAQTATYTCGVCGVSMQMEQPAQQQEPVAVARVDDLERGGRVRALAMGLSLDAPLYTSPQPSKPWVGLTLKETTDIELSLRQYHNGDSYDLSLSDYARAIEAKMRKKNAAPCKPLTHESIAPVRRFLADRGIYLSDETTKALIEAAHGITGGKT